MDLKVSKTCVPFQNTRVSKMTPEESEALRRLKNEIKHRIDPFSVTTMLVRYEYVHRSAFTYLKRMLRNGISRGETCEVMLQNIHYFCKFSDFVHALYYSGHQQLVEKLFMILQVIYAESNVWRSYRAECGNRRRINLFFKDIKRMVHDAKCDNLRQRFREMDAELCYRISIENDDNRKQIIADKRVALVNAEIDAHAITFDNHLSEHGLFHELDGLAVQSSNTVLTNVCYFGRLANAFAISRNFERCNDMLRVAQANAAFCGPSLELANMHYIDVYVKLWEYETNPNEELRKDLMKTGWFGLCNLENEADESIKQLWRRMFILRMVYCLLGIGNRANVFMREPVPSECIEEAKKLLSKIDEMWEGIETRREMFYYVAKARLSALTNEDDMAIEYVNRAEQCATEGHFKELKFIKEYSTELQQMSREHVAGSTPSLIEDKGVYRGNSNCHNNENNGEIQFANRVKPQLHSFKHETNLKVSEEITKSQGHDHKVVIVKSTFSDEITDDSIEPNLPSRGANLSLPPIGYSICKGIHEGNYIFEQESCPKSDQSVITMSYDDSIEPCLPSDGHISFPSVGDNIAYGSSHNEQILCRNNNSNSSNVIMIGANNYRKRDEKDVTSNIYNEMADEFTSVKESFQERNVEFYNITQNQNLMECKTPKNPYPSFSLNQYSYRNNLSKHKILFYDESSQIKKSKLSGHRQKEYEEQHEKRFEHDGATVEEQNTLSDSMEFDLSTDIQLTLPPIPYDTFHGLYSSRLEAHVGNAKETQDSKEYYPFDDARDNVTAGEGQRLETSNFSSQLETGCNSAVSGNIYRKTGFSDVVWQTQPSVQNSIVLYESRGEAEGSSNPLSAETCSTPSGE